MFYDYKCKNEKCSDYDRVTTKSCSINDRDTQKCDNCGEILQRVFTATPIKTFGDGYKG